MGTAPRPWQSNLSNLSVTSKVGIVLLLPVILASVFAVLRIKGELATISQLNTAGEQARIIRPMLEYSSAANQLAITAAGDGPGDRAAKPTLDQDAAHFDQSLANLQAALQVSKADKRVTTAINNALAAGRALRENRTGTSPMQIGKQADEVATHIDTAITALPTPKETAIERYYVQMGVIAIARQMFTQEQLWIISGELGDNPALVSQALLSAGGESATIHQYAAVYPETADRPDVLLAALQTRVDALNQNSVEPIELPGVADSLRTSSGIYTDSTNRLVDLIDTSLRDSLTEARGQVLRDVAIVVVTLLAGLALALAVARSLVVPVRRLRRDALQVAHDDLPAELAVVRQGGATPEIVPVDVQTTEEIGQLARAVDDMHRQALHLAADQARLRLQISSMFETLSRRSQSLVEQQLTLIEDLERDEDDSGRLQSLFRLDHLATRMRRNGDNLLVLAGTALRRGHLPPVPLSDMLWSAVSQVEDYQRVEIGSVPDGIVAGEPAVDIEHLLAELIDNSLRYSPPSTPVAVSVNRAVDGGYLIEITDRGLGMSVDDLTAINERLASGGEVTIETARRMGLFVVGRLAKRHTITVSLRRTSSMSHQSGITAGVHLPGSLVSPADGGAPVTGTFTAPAGVEDEPANATQRFLTAVPSAEPSLYGTTSAGLPQRRTPESVSALAATDSDVDPAPGDRDADSHNGWTPPTTGSWRAVPPARPALNMWADPEDEPGERDYDDADEPGLTTQQTALLPLQSAAEPSGTTSAFDDAPELATHSNLEADTGFAPNSEFGAGTEFDPDSEFDPDTTFDADAEFQKGSEFEADSNSEPRPNFQARSRFQPRSTFQPPPNSANAQADTDAASDPPSGAGQGFGANPQADNGSGFGADPQTDTGSGFDANSQSDTGSRFDANPQADTRSRFSADSQADPGSRFGADPQSTTDSGFGAGSKSGSGSGFMSGSGFATAPREETFPQFDKSPRIDGGSQPDPQRGEAFSPPPTTARSATRATGTAPNVTRPATPEPATARRETTGSTAPESGASGPATPIYQRMVSEWLVEPSSSTPAGMWASPADEGWAAAADASQPATTDRTSGGLPIRRPGAQLVPGGLAPAEEPGAPDPEEIRNNLSRHLSGVRSGRADAQYNDDGGLS
ncbi:ATP-binding protein [Nocardia wallacei]|uniref:ATP-binding protein n=1 Tax=Nocardia wallacei TaxID=480035 RepID=UPI00245766C5|nr:ATP-binding protein [Nocardia wallacei]